MSFSPEPPTPNLSERLTGAKIKKLASLVLRSEHPQTSSAVVAPLLELVSWISCHSCLFNSCPEVCKALIK